MNVMWPDLASEENIKHLGIMPPALLLELETPIPALPYNAQFPVQRFHLGLSPEARLTSDPLHALVFAAAFAHYMVHPRVNKVRANPLPIIGDGRTIPLDVRAEFLYGFAGFLGRAISHVGHRRLGIHLQRMDAWKVSYTLPQA